MPQAIEGNEDQHQLAVLFLTWTGLSTSTTRAAMRPATSLKTVAQHPPAMRARTWWCAWAAMNSS
jgi:hypothetical protein